MAFLLEELGSSHQNTGAYPESLALRLLALQVALIIIKLYTLIGFTLRVIKYCPCAVHIIGNVQDMIRKYTTENSLEQCMVINGAFGEFFQ